MGIEICSVVLVLTNYYWRAISLQLAGYLPAIGRVKALQWRHVGPISAVHWPYAGIKSRLALLQPKVTLS